MRWMIGGQILLFGHRPILGVKQHLWPVVRILGAHCSAIIFLVLKLPFTEVLDVPVACLEDVLDFRDKLRAGGNIALGVRRKGVLIGISMVGVTMDLVSIRLFLIRLWSYLIIDLWLHIVCFWLVRLWMVQRLIWLLLIGIKVIRL